MVIDFAGAAESVLPSFTGAARSMEAGGIAVTATGRYDPVRSRIASTYRFVRGGDDLTATALHHVYTVAQIDALLTEAGFGRIAHFSDTDGSPFTLGAGRLLLTCRRRAAGNATSPR